ncbi:MAG: histidine--tRNA ligase, partial [Leptospirales bacterium]|nr:histidine--tRNA ligase [Leptospirales bacterium]
MIPRPPGTEDIFPDNIERWNRIINAAKDIFKIYNFREIIVPIMEYTEVFSRGLGDATDIVSKEMFTFEDRGGRSLTLRPEGTASVVRAFSENGDYNRLNTVKFFYTGPMFRAERPQKGRLRQFNQLGAEIFGSGDAYHDYEIISMIAAIAGKCNIKDYSILLNSIGCEKCRDPYLEDLKKYYLEREQKLCKDCKTRLHKNALRLLDCKNDSCREIKNGAPIMANYLDDACAAHYADLKKYLNSASIEFTEAPYLVRG